MIRPRLAATGRAERVALALLLALSVAVIVVPALASRDPLRIDDVLARRLVPPLSMDVQGAWHVLGTDRFGRDLFVRMMLAGRLSMVVGTLARRNVQAVYMPNGKTAPQNNGS